MPGVWHIAAATKAWGAALLRGEEDEAEEVRVGGGP